MATTKLRAWPNGRGFDYGEWELAALPDGSWSAARKPHWFGGTSHAGHGRGHADAIVHAFPTPEYAEFAERIKAKK